MILVVFCSHLFEEGFSRSGTYPSQQICHLVCVGLGFPWDASFKRKHNSNSSIEVNMWLFFQSLQSIYILNLQFRNSILVVFCSNFSSLWEKLYYVGLILTKVDKSMSYWVSLNASFERAHRFSMEVDMWLFFQCRERELPLWLWICFSMIFLWPPPWAAQIRCPEPSNMDLHVTWPTCLRRYGCLGAAVNGVFYVIGGLKFSSMLGLAMQPYAYVASMDAFETKTNCWQKTRVLPMGGCVIACTTVGRAIYMLTSHAVELSFWKYDTWVESFTRVKPPPIPSPLRIDNYLKFSCVTMGTDVYIIQVSSQVQLYTVKLWHIFQFWICCLIGCSAYICGLFTVSRWGPFFCSCASWQYSAFLCPGWRINWWSLKKKWSQCTRLQGGLSSDLWHSYTRVVTRSAPAIQPQKEWWCSLHSCAMLGPRQNWEFFPVLETFFLHTDAQDLNSKVDGRFPLGSVNNFPAPVCPVQKS